MHAYQRSLLTLVALGVTTYIQVRMLDQTQLWDMIDSLFEWCE